MSRRRTLPRADERAGLYVRVSLDRAARGLQDEILSPETQEDRCRQYCGAQGWAVAAVEQDLDESGYRQHYSHRRGLMRLLARAERGEISKLVVFKFSRLSRRLKEFLEICDRVESAGAGIVSITEQIDTSTPAGRLIRNIMASFAQFQSEEIGEQIFESWLTKAKRGERPPGFAPFGTLNTRGLLKPDPATHPHLLAIFRRFLASRSIRAVWDYLDEHRIPAPRAASWNLNTIRAILANPVYVGRLSWAGELFAARWEPLVPEELWEAAQQLLAARKGAPPVRRDAHLLTGMIRCGHCGRPMRTRYARGAAAAGGSRRLYWCASPQDGRRGCAVAAVAGAEAEQAVWAAVTAVVGLAAPGSTLARPGDEGERRRLLHALGTSVTVGARVWLHLPGLRIDLQGRRTGATWHFGEHYQRLDYQGSLLTDKQERFIRRAYNWADKKTIARRIGRSYPSLIQLARRMRREGLLSGRKG